MLDSHMHIYLLAITLIFEIWCYTIGSVQINGTVLREHDIDFPNIAMDIFILINLKCISCTILSGVRSVSTFIGPVYILLP